MIFEVFPHKVVIIPERFKLAKNSICDTCALNLRNYKIFEVLPHTVVKTVKRSIDRRTRFVILVH